MSIRFKPRIEITEAVSVTSPIAQASDIAGWLNPASFSVDQAEGTATFTFLDEKNPSPQVVTVKAGQTISVTAGKITIYQTSEFNRLFEPELTI